jgi:hypothetical protein
MVGEWTCKPGSVRVASDTRRSFLYDDDCSPPLAAYPRVAKRAEPTRRGRFRASLCLALLRVGFTEPIESPRPLVRSYRTFSPLPNDRLIDGGPASSGGVLSVALSLTSRPVDVIDHPVLWSPDFPPAQQRRKPLQASDRPIRSPTIRTIAAEDRGSQEGRGVSGTTGLEIQDVIQTIARPASRSPRWSPLSSRPTTAQTARFRGCQQFTSCGERGGLIVHDERRSRLPSKLESR